MTTDRRERAEELFKAAVDLDTAARNTMLEQACAGDADLRLTVESLLAADAEGSAFLETPAWPASDVAFAEADPTTERKDLAGHIIQQIGPYRIVRELDHGGMGVVYIGVREDDRFRRTAAVKVLKRGMDTADILRRFELERQVLSALNHPNIARLLDGGMTGDGRPYFAMEYIEGEPIDGYCDSHRLSTTERLRLFEKVCRAVHHAHKNLIVHRDLKPGNILVTRDGEPKLLDFGIAKLLNRDLAGGIAAQPTGSIDLMTPQYASPEQVSGRPITTASDVYSLGVVLYELLTGHKPYRMDVYASAEFVRVICEEDPDKPSTAVATTEQVATGSITPEEVSRTRDGRVDRLRRRLRGDIDNIVLKAMAKAPQRRYQSSEEMAADIERHLKGYPVTARPDSVRYRAVKFVRRNRIGVAMVVVIGIAMLASLVAVGERLRGQAAATETAVETARADAEEARADAAQVRAESAKDKSNQLVVMIQEISDVVTTLDQSLRTLPGALEPRQQLVDRALAVLVRLEQFAADDPGVRRHLATGYSRVGHARFSTNRPHKGDLAGAVELQEKALEIRETLHAEFPDDVGIAQELADSHNVVGDLLRESPGMEAEALERYETARVILDDIDARSAAKSSLRHDWAATLVNIGDILRKQGRIDEAFDIYEESMLCREANLRHEVSAKTRRAVAVGYGRLASVFEDRREYEQAAAWRRKDLEKRLALLESDPENGTSRRDAWFTRCVLARVLLKGRADEPDQPLDAEEALRLVDAAQPIIEALADADPVDARLRVDLGYHYATVVRVHLTLEDEEAAAVAIGRLEGAIRGLQALDRDHPKVPQLRRDLRYLGRMLDTPY